MIKGGILMKEITHDMLAQFRTAYEADGQAQVLHSALAKTDMADLAYVPVAGARLKGAFSVEVKTRGITAQQKSGRCWLFAALNILREKVAETCHLDQFELSQNYLSFYDKLEKANNFLEMVIDNAQEPIKGQLMQYVLRGMTDGGYWSEAVDLIEKYGVVPKQVQPETYQSNHIDRFVATLNRLLRKDAMELRELVQDGADPYPRKAAMMAEVYKAACIAFGQPVQTFDFAYRDKDGNYHEERDLTPQAFYQKYVGLSLRDYVAVINEPTADKPLDTPIQFHAVENMAGCDMKALNLSQEALEELCVKQLKNGQAIWFACDAGAFGARKKVSGTRPASSTKPFWAAFRRPCPRANGWSITVVRRLTPCCSQASISTRKASRTVGKSKIPGARMSATKAISSALKLISRNSSTKPSSTAVISARPN